MEDVSTSVIRNFSIPPTLAPSVVKHHLMHSLPILPHHLSFPPSLPHFCSWTVFIDSSRTQPQGPLDEVLPPSPPSSPAEHYFFGFLGEMSMAGPGAGMSMGNMSTHNSSRPCNSRKTWLVVPECPEVLHVGSQLFAIQHVAPSVMEIPSPSSWHHLWRPPASIGRTFSSRRPLG